MKKNPAIRILLATTMFANASLAFAQERLPELPRPIAVPQRPVAQVPVVVPAQTPTSRPAQNLGPQTQTPVTVAPQQRVVAPQAPVAMPVQNPVLRPTAQPIGTQNMMPQAQAVPQRVITQNPVQQTPVATSVQNQAVRPVPPQNVIPQTPATVPAPQVQQQRIVSSNPISQIPTVVTSVPQVSQGQIVSDQLKTEEEKEAEKQAFIRRNFELIEENHRFKKEIEKSELDDQKIAGENIDLMHQLGTFKDKNRKLNQQNDDLIQQKDELRKQGFEAEKLRKRKDDQLDTIHYLSRPQDDLNKKAPLEQILTQLQQRRYLELGIAALASSLVTVIVMSIFSSKGNTPAPQDSQA